MEQIPAEGRWIVVTGYSLIFLLLQEIAKLNEELKKYQNNEDKN